MFNKIEEKNFDAIETKELEQIRTQLDTLFNVSTLMKTQVEEISDLRNEKPSPLVQERLEATEVNFKASAKLGLKILKKMIDEDEHLLAFEELAERGEDHDV